MTKDKLEEARRLGKCIDKVTADLKLIDIAEADYAGPLYILSNAGKIQLIGTADKKAALAIARCRCNEYLCRYEAELKAL